MSDIKLFRTKGQVVELSGTSVTVEKSLQTLFEKNLEALLGVRFLESEYSTGPIHRGRIDTLGIDEDNSPVIIEYKRATNENVINQGLYYLDWLLDHKAEFQLLVQKKFGQQIADAIDWTSPRLICVAGDYTKFDQHAVQQIYRQIELIRYKRYGEDLLLLELVNVPQTPSRGVEGGGTHSPNGVSSGSGSSKTFADALAQVDAHLLDVYTAFRDYMLALGDDIQVKQLKYYEAFKRIRNVASVVIQPQKRDLLVYIYKTPDMDWTQMEIVREVDKVGHWGTGDLEITLRSLDDLEKAKPLLEKAYDRS
jgi:predicted transport protein